MEKSDYLTKEPVPAGAIAIASFSLICKLMHKIVSSKLLTKTEIRKIIVETAEANENDFTSSLNFEAGRLLRFAADDFKPSEEDVEL